jgi:hypothetical protein
MNRKVLLLLGLMILAVVAVNGFVFIQIFFAQKEIPGKVEWSALQAAEEKFRQNDTEHMLLYQVEDYFLVGVRGNNSGKRIWLLLNPKSPPTVKKIPEGDYVISRDEFEKIKAFHHAHPAVVEELQSHCHEMK